MVAFLQFLMSSSMFSTISRKVSFFSSLHVPIRDLYVRIRRSTKRVSLWSPIRLNICIHLRSQRVRMLSGLTILLLVDQIFF